MRRRYLRIGAFFSVLFAIGFLWNVLFHLGSPLAIAGDGAYSYFMQQNTLTKLTALNFKDLYETRMFYPLRNTAAFGNGEYPISITALPFFILSKNLIFSVNTALIISFAVSFFSAYVLIFFYTKQVGASLIGATIYTYNPLEMAHIGQFENVVLYCIPLALYAIERYLVEPRWRWGGLLAVLLFVQLTASFYYFLFLLILLPIYIGARFRSRVLFTRKLLIPLLLSAIVGAIFLVPYVKVRSIYGAVRSREEVVRLSLEPTDFLFTSWQNYIYGGLAKNIQARQLRNPFTAVHPNEHSLYPGTVVVVLVFPALYSAIKKKTINRRFIILYCACVLYALGPKFPPFMLLTKCVPFADSLRVPIRFMTIGYLFLALLISLNWKKGRVATGIVLLLLLVEYQQNFGSFIGLSESTSRFYDWLAKEQSVQVLVELPVDEPSRYLYPAIFDNKSRVNGYAGFIPQEARDLQDSLRSDFPTAEKLSSLQSIGVDLIVVHGEPKTADSLRESGLREVYSSSTIHAFSF